MTPLEQLARDVLDMLALQSSAESTKDMDRIRKYRGAKIKLIAGCKAILHPQQNQPKLFEEPSNDLS